jgi:hypothetical protein
MAFKTDYLTRYDTLNRFVKQQRAGATAGAGAASRSRTKKMVGLGQAYAEETQKGMESSAKGVRRMFEQVDVRAGREEQNPDIDIAAWMQGIEETAEENQFKPEEKDEDDKLSKVDFDEGMLEFALGAIGDIESLGSGGYQAVGPVVAKGMYKGKRAYGKYQVMEPNIGPWTEKYYGTRLTTQEFLNSEEAQDAVAENMIMSNWEKYGTIEDAVSVWFTGKPVKDAGEVSDGYTTAPEYLKKWNENFIRRRDEALGAT